LRDGFQRRFMPLNAALKSFDSRARHCASYILTLYLMAQQSTPQGRGWKIGIAVLAVAVALFFLLRYEFRSTVGVTVATVGYQDIRSVVSTNGIVEPINDYQAHAPAPGVVNKIFVHVGDKVAQGQEIIQMDDVDARDRVATAQATLTSAEATLKNMQNGGTHDELLTTRTDLTNAQTQQTQAAAALASLQALQAKGAASANEVESAQQKLQSAQNRVVDLKTRKTGRYGSTDFSAQEAQVSNAREGVVAAQSALAGVDIHSPLSGTVYYAPVSQYDYVPGGKPLLYIADLTKLRVRAYFDEPDIGKLSVGQPVTIVWGAKPNRVWHGHIQQAPTTVIEYGTRNVGECVITIDDANGDLLPNTNVTVTVTTQQKAHVLSIPREALHTEGQYDYVYKIVRGHLQKTPVQVGVLNLTLVEVTSGLNDGDTVVLAPTNGEDELTDGLEVKAQP